MSMRYLYGDSSEFPLNQNFIETAAAATDMAVALLKVDELIVRAKKTTEEANDAARGELADLEELARLRPADRQRTTRGRVARVLTIAPARTKTGIVSNGHSTGYSRPPFRTWSLL